MSENSHPKRVFGQIAAEIRGDAPTLEDAYIARVKGAET